MTRSLRIESRLWKDLICKDPAGSLRVGLKIPQGSLPTRILIKIFKQDNLLRFMLWRHPTSTTVCIKCKLMCLLVDHSLQGHFRINQPNGIRPNACEGTAQVCHTAHVWSHSTANPARCNWLRVHFGREENRSTWRKTLRVTLISTETQPTYDPRSELNLGHRGGRRGWWPLNHPDSPPTP